ncbi:hypothetical protein BJX70DRAFT_258402 [Aspergillus crustosus]
MNRLVPNGSGAFGTLSKMPPWGATPEVVSRFSGRILKELEQLFLNGKASPYDEQHNRQILLHAACAISPLTPAESDYQLDVIRFLLNHKCPVNCLDNNKQTPLDILLFSGGGDSAPAIIDLLCASRATYTIAGEYFPLLKMVKLLASKSEKAGPACDVIAAITTRSQGTLDRAHTHLNK